MNELDVKPNNIMNLMKYIEIRKNVSKFTDKIWYNRKIYVDVSSNYNKLLEEIRNRESFN